MGAKEKALELMERDPVLYMDMLGPFHRGMTEIVAQSEEGLLLYNAPGRAYMLAADTRAEAEALPLSREDREALAEAAGGLSGDEEQVCRALTAAAVRLRRSLEAERAASPEREKRSAALWLSGGALLVILLI